MDNIVTGFGVGASPIGMNMQWAIWKGLYEFGFNLLPLTGDKKPMEKFLEWTEKRQPVETFERFYTKLSPPQMAFHTGVVWEGLPGFVVIDLSDVYDGQDITTIRLAEWDYHPNFRGHQLSASHLFDALQAHRAAVFGASPQ